MHSSWDTGRACRHGAATILSLLPTRAQARFVLCKKPEAYYLNFDIGFLGFTQMYPTETEPVVDIVLLSGIGSHAYGSWRSKSEPWHMWPRHFLRQDFPNARVMIYGYKAALAGVDFGHLLDHNPSFGHEFEQVRKDPHRPIIFIAHSLVAIF